jgi:general secretion pathway protein B
VLAGLLCVNVAVLLVIVLRGGTPDTANTAINAGAHKPREMQSHEPPAADAAQPSTAAAAAAAAAAADHFSPMDNPPVYAPEIPVQEDGTTSTPTTSAPNVTEPGLQSAPPAHAARRADAGRADPVLNDEPPEDEEMLPSINELNLTGNQSLPDIHLDVHVYASRPADRFVYINMRKYREGAVLQEGPTLERIRRDGVVLNYNGLRFFVPRQ